MGAIAERWRTSIDGRVVLKPECNTLDSKYYLLSYQKSVRVKAKK